MNKIPFYDYVVSKENFDSVKSFENISIKIEKNLDNINIQFKNTFPSNLFYFIDKNNNYYLSLNEELLANYIKNNNIGDITNSNDYIDWLNKKQTDKPNWSISLLKTNKYTEIQRIYKLWNKICVFRDCHFDVEYIENDKIASIPIRESGEIIKNWIIKYKNIFNSLKNELLIFELSAGLDSRALTWFFRNNKELNYKIYSKQSDIELPIAKQVMNYLNVEDKFIEKKISGITVSGIGNSTKSFNGRDIFENYVGIQQSKHLIKDICPYFDRDFLKIYGDYPQQVKLIIQILLSEDLINIPYITWMGLEYKFNSQIIKECKTIINNWLKIDINSLK